MAFKLTLSPLNESCDICKKVDTTRPMLWIATTGRTRDERNFVWVHLDEFERRLAKVKEQYGNP